MFGLLEITNRYEKLLQFHFKPIKHPKLSSVHTGRYGYVFIIIYCDMYAQSLIEIPNDPTTSMEGMHEYIE